MLATRNLDLEGKKIAISGSGNVAQFAAEKVIELGGSVLTFSDSNGSIVDEEGIDRPKLDYVMDLKNNRRGRIKEYVKQYPNAVYLEEQRPWSVECEVAMPCATQNEINAKEARMLIDNGCYCVAEGANMPSEPEAIETYLEAGILFGPGKAANAGGVAVSGLEMTQNSMRLAWTRKEVDKRLHAIMKEIHQTCVRYGKEGDFINYVNGANVGGFIKVAEAMLDQGVV